MLTVDIDWHPEGVTVRPAGDLDAAAAATLDAALSAIPARDCVTIDLSDVAFIDSAGLGALLQAIRRITVTGQVVISGARHSVRKFLQMTGVDRIVPVIDEGQTVALDTTAPHGRDQG